MSLPWEKDVKPAKPTMLDADVVAVCSELSKNENTKGVVWSVIPIVPKLVQPQWDAIKMRLSATAFAKALEMREYAYSIGFR
jgi:hypothetical protein